jgi:hypothetical protein
MAGASVLLDRDSGPTEQLITRDNSDHVVIDPQADSGQRTADSGQRTADSGQRTADRHP